MCQFAIFMVDLAAMKISTHKINVSTANRVLACMEAIKVRGVAKSTVVAQPTVLSANE